jgi:hypothetical protein
VFEQKLLGPSFNQEKGWIGQGIAALTAARVDLETAEAQAREAYETPMSALRPLRVSSIGNLEACRDAFVRKPGRREYP